MQLAQASLLVRSSVPGTRAQRQAVEGQAKAAANPAVPGLVDRAAKGDAEAFGNLYDLLIDDVYRYFYYHLGSPHDAEDMASRTFMRAWRAIGSFKWRGKPFESWLFTLARNQLMDFYRERRAPMAELDERRADPSLGPEGRALVMSEAESTRAALAKLTEEQRQVLVLKFYMERDNHEIARIMGKKEGTVRALQMRALQAMRRHLANV